MKRSLRSAFGAALNLAIAITLAVGGLERVATHFGTFQLADDAETEPQDRIAAAAVPEFLVLGFGEGRDVLN